MDKTGPNPPTRRDHLIPPVPRAKQLPPAGTNTNQKGCLVCNKKKPSRSAAQRKAGKQTSSKQHQASKASNSPTHLRDKDHRPSYDGRDATQPACGAPRAFPDEMAGNVCRVQKLEPNAALGIGMKLNMLR